MADYITTYTGIHFYPTDPDPEAINIEDIAHALSLLCRGNGHVSTFWSVAQHCIICAREAAAREWPDRLVLACLLHDASECYLSDVPRPFKAELVGYREHEDRLLAAAQGEGSLSVAFVGSHEQVEAAGSSGSAGERDDIAATGKTVGGVFLAQAEGDVVHHELALGKELGGVAVATLEVGSAAEGVEGGAVAVEGEGNR